MVILRKPVSYPLEYEWSDITGIAPLRREFDDLGKVALDPNPFFAFDYLRAMARHLSANTKVHLLLLRDANGKLRGVFPLQVEGIRTGKILPVISLYVTPYSTCGVPLIDRHFGPEALTAFFDAIRERDDFPGVIHIPEYYADCKFATLLEQFVGESGLKIAYEESIARPVAQGGKTFEAYLQNVSRNQKKARRNRLRKLQNSGPISFETVRCDQPGYQEAFDEFLKLEASGWKGKSGTALLSNKTTKLFADEALAAPGSSPAVEVSTLRLDGRAIASCVNCISQNRYYSLKSAYDEDYAQYGPGGVLDFELLRRFFEDSRMEEFDSCVNAAHPLDGILLERRSVGDVFITTQANQSRLLNGVVQTFRLYKSMKKIANGLLSRK